jgi:hypothetical protein
MSTLTSVPVAVSPEATKHVDGLGLQSEFEAMLEHTLEAVPGLRGVDVTLAHDPEGEDVPRVIIVAYMEYRGLEYDPTEDDWGRWLVTWFTPDVSSHFAMITAYEATDSR